MNADRHEIIGRWLAYPGDKLEPPTLVKMAYRAERRDLEIAKFAQFAEPYLTDLGERGNMADLVTVLEPVYRQLSLELPSMSKRAAVRLALAEAIEQKVVPISPDPWVHKLPRRLREARQSYSVGYRIADKKHLVMWDNKAGLSRLCPDDSREETARLTRRLMPTLESEARRGARFTYAVFTIPNVAPGKLEHEMRKIFGRLRSVLLRRRPHVKGTKRSKRPLFFPEISGWLAVLEAPLSKHRDWNVHVNVLLVHHGFMRWEELRALWHWNVYLEVVQPQAEGEHGLRASLREIIKYSAKAVAEKSDEKSRNRTSSNARPGAGESRAAADADVGSAPRRVAAHDLEPCVTDHGDDGMDARAKRVAPLDDPPPMTEWEGEELLEWLLAFRKTRRTRTYGCLYGLDKPEKMDMTGFLWIGKGTWEGDRYRLRFSPLDSIPGDKSGRIGPLDRLADFVRRLRGHPPPDIPVNSAGEVA